MILRMFAIFACSLLRPLLDRFWDDFGTKNRPKVDPKRVPKGVENHVRFLVPSRPSKNQFSGQHAPNMVRFWPPRWPQVGSQMGSKSVQNRARKRNWLRNRFWDDFGTILGRFWVHVWLIFGSFWLRLGCFWLLSCIELPYKHVHRHVRRFIHARAHTCPQITYMSCNANALPVPCSHRFF